jgi:hypothetical protein
MIALDVECYPNYALLVFSNGVWWELHDGVETGSRSTVASTMASRLTFGFNSLWYDLPMIEAIINGADNSELHQLTQHIIERGERVSHSAGWDHIDIKEVLPGVQVGLKLYAGRLHYRAIQDLPIPPNATITLDDAPLLRKYCANDVRVTIALAKQITAQLELRCQLSEQYGIDLRSKSDAQIAEAVLISEIETAKGSRIENHSVSAGSAYRYNTPAIPYTSEQLRGLLRDIHESDFRINDGLQLTLPESLQSRVVTIGSGAYRLGIGGLHSSEQGVSYYADDERCLIDIDVASYYPAIIIQQGLYPHQCGADFLTTYKSIVDRRLEAKRSGNKVVADSLKITINGSFGKFGSVYSRLCSPQLLIQVTLTGQLALLWLIERLHLAGIDVISANTDGIVTHPYRWQLDTLRQIYKEWEADTGFAMEETEYRSIHSRDVNNYIAVKTDHSVKRKGVFSKAGLNKNPQFEILADAVVDKLSHEVPIADSVDCCEDMKKFVTVRKVAGGARWRGELVGSVVRWYYSTDGEAIIYANNGHRVPTSESSTVALELPEERPANLDIDRYIRSATELHASLFQSQLQLF